MTWKDPNHLARFGKALQTNGIKSKPGSIRTHPNSSDLLERLF